MKKWILVAALSFSAVSATLNAPTVWAASGAPSVNDVEAAIARGDMFGAESMLDQVIAAHPKSARAHYLDAQVLERNHRYADALTQLNTARSLDPAITFTDHSRFQAVQRRIEAESARMAAGGTLQTAPSAPSPAARASTMSNDGGMPGTVTPPARHGFSPVMWIGLLIVILAVVALVRWGMRKRRNDDEIGAIDTSRAQLKRATELLDAVRAAKLDLKLSTSPDKAGWVAEAEDAEAQLRGLIDALSGGARPPASDPTASPAYQLETLERRVARIQALAAGRPDPNLTAAADERSAYAAEADRLNRGAPYGQQPPPPWQQGQQPPVIVQQPSSGLGAGLGGLLGGVVLGEMLGGNRERDVIVEHDQGVPNAPPQQDAGNAPFDFGNGGDNWGDGGGQIDAGNGDDNSWGDNT